MFASLLAAHSLLNRMYPGAALPAAPPAPPWTPRPIVSQPISFAVTATPSLFGIVGSAIGSTTLATVTCADAAMTISLSEPVPGLTFAYAANVLTVSGTPTTPTGVHRVNVSYVASDGSGAARGASSHTITIVSASEVLSIGSMAAVVGRVGVPQSSIIASPTTNYAVDVTALSASLVPGLSVSLTWTKGASSGAGTLTVIGTPTAAGTYTLAVNFFASGGVLIGTSTHTTTIAEAYQPTPTPPAPSPPPSPPSPSPPPAPSPTPQPGAGPDLYWPDVKVLMHFDEATGLLTDVKGNTLANRAATEAAATTGAVAQAALFSAQTCVGGSVAGIDGSNGSLAIDCWVDIDETAWNALNDSSPDARFCPVISATTEDGIALWSLGFLSDNIIHAGYFERRVVFPFFWSSLTKSAIAPIILSRPGRFVHLAAGRRVVYVNQFYPTIWIDGRAGLNSVNGFISSLPRFQATRLQLGGYLMDLRWGPNAKLNQILFSGAIDEVRVTAAERYGEHQNLHPSDLWASERVIPWPNY